MVVGEWFSAFSRVVELTPNSSKSVANVLRRSCGVNFKPVIWPTRWQAFLGSLMWVRTPGISSVPRPLRLALNTLYTTCACAGSRPRSDRRLRYHHHPRRAAPHWHSHAPYGHQGAGAATRHQQSRSWQQDLPLSSDDSSLRSECIRQNLEPRGQSLVRCHH